MIAIIDVIFENCMQPKNPAWGACKRELRTTKYRFSYIHRSEIFYLKSTKFGVEVSAYNRRLHSKFEVNCASHF